MELDARKLYLGEGCSSLFTYCTQVLHLSEHAAYGRIEAARAAQRYPAHLDHLADGSLTLTTVCLVAPVLTAENQQVVLASARHQSKRAVEQLVATLRPRPEVKSVVRKLPTPLPAKLMPPTSESELPSVLPPPENDFWKHFRCVSATDATNRVHGLALEPNSGNDWPCRMRRNQTESITKDHR